MSTTRHHEILERERNERIVLLGEKLFALELNEDWSAIPLRMERCGVADSDVILIDALGRVCRSRWQWLSARSDDAFPITAYNINT